MQNPVKVMQGRVVTIYDAGQKQPLEDKQKVESTKRILNMFTLL